MNKLNNELEKSNVIIAEYDKNLELIMKENVSLKEKMNKTEKFLVEKEN
jgi:hypothetical protein